MIDGQCLEETGVSIGGIALTPQIAPASCPATAPTVSESSPKFTAISSASSKLLALPTLHSAASNVSTTYPDEEISFLLLVRQVPAATFTISPCPVHFLSERASFPSARMLNR